MEYLSVDEYAALRGCTSRYVRTLIQQGKVRAEMCEGLKRGGNSGEVYQIPLPSIEPKLLTKYKRIRKQKEKEKLNIEPEKVVKLNYELISEDDRKEIELWKEILQNWRSFRNGDSVRDKKAADEQYVEFANITYPTVKVTVRGLYRKWKALTEEGEEALIDKRGRHGNHKKALSDDVWDIFEAFYLDQNQPTVAQCLRLTETQLKKNGMEDKLPLPSYDTFIRYIEKLPVAILKYYRLGEKAFYDQCVPYIKRRYDDLSSNDVWVTDNHTFDIMIAKDEAPVRVYLTAFLDVKSRKFVGWYVTDAPRSDATVYALRRGIEKYGIPKMIYSDNGREFLTHDIGGRGFRKSTDVEHEPPTILQRLGIEFTTALVRNAKAKIIERRFLDVKETFSKMFEAYTGGNVLERPERLKHIVKNVDNLVVLDDFREFVDTYIENIINKMPSNAEGMFGKCPDEVFANNLIEMRTASEDELNLMMLRNSRMQKVKRNGVMFKLYDKELWYGNDDVLMNHLGESVYFRYNPDDLNTVRIYDDKDRYLCTGKLRNQLSYFASKDEIAENMKANRAAAKAVKSYKKQKGIQNDTELELTLWQAEQNAGINYELNPNVIIPIRYQEEVEQDEYAAAVGGADAIDWEKAVERLRAVKEEMK